VLACDGSEPSSVRTLSLRKQTRHMTLQRVAKKLIKNLRIVIASGKEAAHLWWLVVGCWLLVVGCWLVVGGWWLVVGGWWLVVGGA
jgi:hypothetical protein